MAQSAFMFKNFPLFFLMMASCTHPMEDAKDASGNSFLENVLVGSAAGAAEVVVNQPTVFVKNALQQQKKSWEVITKSPRTLYKGLGINAVCMIPTTAAQISVSDTLKQYMPSDDIKTSVVRNAVAGASSALLCNPSELIIINQQNWKTDAWTTARRLYEQNGLQVGARGYIAKASRDGSFCTGFLTVYPLVKEKLKEKTGRDIQATLLATALVGPPTAAISHPFDTISTKMQADPEKTNVQGFLDAATKIRRSGFKTFFAGFVPRTLRIMVAIPLMSGVKDYLTSDN